MTLSFFRKFSRKTKQRKALFKNLLTALIIFGKIKTSEAKGKTIKRLADKLVTLAKKSDLASRRGIFSLLPKLAAEKLISQIEPSFQSRQSGFTRIIKLGQRLGDRSPQVLLEWVAGKKEEGEKISKNQKLGKAPKREKEASQETKGVKDTRKRKLANEK